MTTQTLTALRQLKLGGMANALQSQLEQVGTYEGLAFTERLALLVEQETLIREQRKQERLIRQARFKRRGLRCRHQLSTPAQHHRIANRTPGAERLDQSRPESADYRPLW